MIGLNGVKGVRSVGVTDVVFPLSPFTLFSSYSRRTTFPAIAPVYLPPSTASTPFTST